MYRASEDLQVDGTAGVGPRERSTATLCEWVAQERAQQLDCLLVVAAVQDDYPVSLPEPGHSGPVVDFTADVRWVVWIDPRGGRRSRGVVRELENMNRLAIRAYDDLAAGERPAVGDIHNSDADSQGFQLAGQPSQPSWPQVRGRTLDDGASRRAGATRRVRCHRIARQFAGRRRHRTRTLARSVRRDRRRIRNG